MDIKNIKSNVEFKYLDATNQYDSFGIKVNTVGFQQITPKTVYPPKSHPTGYHFNSKLGRKSE